MSSKVCLPRGDVRLCVVAASSCEAVHELSSLAQLLRAPPALHADHHHHHVCPLLSEEMVFVGWSEAQAAVKIKYTRRNGGKDHSSGAVAVAVVAVEVKSSSRESTWNEM